MSLHGIYFYPFTTAQTDYKDLGSYKLEYMILPSHFPWRVSMSSTKTSFTVHPYKKWDISSGPALGPRGRMYGSKQSLDPSLLHGTVMGKYPKSGWLHIYKY